MTMMTMAKRIAPNIFQLQLLAAINNGAPKLPALITPRIVAERTLMSNR